MADEQQKQGWWRSIPGVLTAGTGFLAALSGLLAGLNQMGAFDRLKAPVSAPVIAGVVDSGSTSTAAVKPDSTPPPQATARPPSTPSRPTSTPSRPTSGVPPAPTAPSPDSVRAATSRPTVLPSGTVLELTSREKVCSATSKAGDRISASLVTPVTVKGGLVLPTGTQAILRVQHPPAPNFLGMRLDSIVRSGDAVPVPKAEVRLRREVVKGQGGAPVGACVPAGARIRATLRAPIRLQGS